ncbi:AGAP008813-PA-like protein [Anopheles sinensis]|uniref:AGAP008813-PA-like protein n=1 Tax=Anopheles sinensis TaxID=74873 RepID=A0A084VPC4_ANOSI|nr:AGAP008813-PA-like protein [Anopheles sinensis]
MDLFGDYKDHMQDYEAQFNASSIYVWLSDPNTPIVPQENTNIEAVDGVKFVAQCRPTSKSVQLELVLAADNKTSIGRMERSAGMVVDFDSLDNGASYICRDKERPNFYTTLSTHYVARPFYLYRPNIASECGNIVPEGSTVVLNCTVAFCDGRKPNMEWYFNGEPLVQSEKLLLSERLETSNDEDYCLNEMSETLTIQNAEKSDAGSYMCKTVEGWSSNFANYKLYVMETGGDFVYFNPVDNQPVVNVSRSAGRPARIILNYDSYPNLHSVEWYKDDKPICVSCKKGHRYEVIVTPTELQLIIKNPTVYDAARYTAVAKVGSIKEQYDVMLFVFDKPTLKMNSIYAVVGEHLNFSCQSRAYPEPVMDLYFIPCSSQEWSDCMAYEESERVNRELRSIFKIR